MADDDGSAPIRDRFAAQGLHPDDRELALYAFLAPVLRAMVDQLHAVETGSEL